MILLGASAVVPVLEGQFGGHRRRRPRGRATGLSPDPDCADWPTPGGQAEATGQHGQQAEAAATQEDTKTKDRGRRPRPDLRTAPPRRGGGGVGIKGFKKEFSVLVNSTSRTDHTSSWRPPSPSGRAPTVPPLASVACLSFWGRNAKELKEMFFPCAEIPPQIRGDNFHYLKISERNSIFKIFFSKIE